MKFDISGKNSINFIELDTNWNKTTIFAAIIFS